MKLRIDKKIAALFEGLEEWTYEELRRDIKKNGIRDPLIVAKDGTIVCGHQRYKIALELGIAPPYVVKKFKDRSKMIEYAIKDNVLRRQLNTYSKGLVALKFLEVESKIAKKRKGIRTDLMDKTSVKDFTKVKGRADVKAAKRVGISHTTLRRVKRIEENGSEDLRLRARRGDISVERAFLELREWEFGGSPVKSFSPPRLSESKVLDPVKNENGEWTITTTIPEDWYRGVKVTIRPIQSPILNKSHIVVRDIEAKETKKDKS